MQTIKITTSQNIDIDYELVDLGNRIVARLIDLGIFLGVYVACFIILAIFTGLTNDYNGQGQNVGIIAIAIVWLVLFLLYDLVFEIFMDGQSIGKRAMKIKVISLNGARPTIGQYLLRWIFRLVDFGITGGSGAIISVVLSDKKQRIGDIVAGTTIISLAPKTNFNDLIFGPPPADYFPVYNETTQLTDKDIVLIYDVIRNFNRTRNSLLVYKLAMQIKAFLKISYTNEINEYQFLEIVLNDYNSLMAKSEG
jgi:uncharacterized RDD family membrane protein YckC